ncbi:hypothetical protein VTN00DRAFT_2547 [Thermoascus crustaceus]
MAASLQRRGRQESSHISPTLSIGRLD